MPEVEPLGYRALNNANVVIYDRALAPTVALVLPDSADAEPVVSATGSAVQAPSGVFAFSATAGAWLGCSIPAFGRHRQRLDTIRQLSHRLLTEMSADLPVQIFAFEALTGYSLDEVHGKTPRNSGNLEEQGPEIYQEMWKAIFGGGVFRGS